MSIPALSQRIADIPEIFLSSLKNALAQHEMDAGQIVPLLGGDHFEAMCLDGFPVDNVRGILDLTDRLVSKIVTGVTPADAVAQVFAERFLRGPVVQRYSRAPMPAGVSARTPVHASEAPKPTPSGDDSHSHYEAHKDQIIATYIQCNGNLSATERMLRSQGIRCTRRWIGIFAAKWGLR